MSNRAEWATDLDWSHFRWLIPTGDVELTPDGPLLRDNSLTFHNMMVAAMVQNGFKYGDIAKAYPDRVDALGSANERLLKYDKDGNVRWLVDAANFIMCEFIHPRHPDAHLGEDRSIGRVVPGVSDFTEKSNHELTAPAIAFRMRDGD